MPVDNFSTQFDKMTTTKDRMETRSLTTKMCFHAARFELFCAFMHTFSLLWSIVKIVWALSYAAFFGLGAIVSRIRLARHRRHIAKTLLKQYQA